LTIGGRQFTSRLLLGTGKFSSHEVMREALDASGAEIITVALRRVDLTAPETDILRFIDRKKYCLLPNTSGARTADEAILLARLAREAGLGTWVKLEVETVRAAETLVKEGFTVLPYMGADPVLAQRLQDAGTATVMPLGSPIGSNRGLRTRDALRIIIEQARVPVVVDAGLGAPSHAAEAMEIGADAVLVNTAIAVAGDPVAMAEAFRLGVAAGRTAFESGCAPEREGAEASSPLTGFLNVEQQGASPEIPSTKSQIPNKHHIPMTK
jgi:thiazole synthase